MTDPTEATPEYVNIEHHDALQLHRGNVRLMNELQGMGMSIDPASIVNARLEMLIDMIYPETSEERWVFEKKFETEINTNLETAIVEARKMVLLNGVASPRPVPGGGGGLFNGN